MAPKKTNNNPTDKEVHYDKLIATIPAIERKGDTNPYTFSPTSLLRQLLGTIRKPVEGLVDK